MEFAPTRLTGVIVIQPDVFRDERGFFLETYRFDKYARGGIKGHFVQDNHSRSLRDTIRGLHAQRKHPQDKLVRVLAGKIFDVVADIRPESPTYLQWISVELSSANFLQLYIPSGYSHGVCILSDFAELEYKCTDFYDPTDELRIVWNDPSIGIEWPIKNPILSLKDRNASTLAEQIDILPRFGGAAA